jgi:hypothetical protein
MHIPADKIAPVIEQVKALEKSFPPVVVFSNSMDKALINDTIELISGLTNTKNFKQKGHIEVFPNPFKNSLSITTASAAPAYGFIFNASGANVHSFKLQKPETKINTCNLNRGLYYIVIGHETKIVIKE